MCLKRMLSIYVLTFTTFNVLLSLLVFEVFAGIGSVCLIICMPFDFVRMLKGFV